MQSTPIYQRAVTPTTTDVGFTDAAGHNASRIVGAMGHGNNGSNGSSSSYISSSGSGGGGSSSSSGFGLAGLSLGGSSSSSSSGGIVRGKVLQYNQQPSPRRDAGYVQSGPGSHRQRSSSLLQPAASSNEDVQPHLPRSSSVPKAAFAVTPPAAEAATHADSECTERSDASAGGRLPSHGLPQAQRTPKSGGTSREAQVHPPSASSSDGGGGGGGSSSNFRDGSTAPSSSAAVSNGKAEMISSRVVAVSSSDVHHSSLPIDGGRASALSPSLSAMASATTAATAPKAFEEAKFHQAFDAWMKKTILETIECARLAEHQRGK